ncbi:hypothetical protein PHYBOEH_010388 [Phytophthora boehmeriae]|uniref:Uncharacterized protein n=1 Tax=Phytophthora boehmeriae TaxID=109152 RepID=A0A8T1VN15_9STRA|nr:hypothetical protein PHYBOEH_010388 [Phytophthora boehmeriae]
MDSTGFCLQEDEIATVEEIISFIDSCDFTDDLLQECGISPCAGKSSLTSSETQVVDSSGGEQGDKALKKRRRIRTGWSSSTGLQRRKRAELQFLRAHVRELEAHLERLKGKNASANFHEKKESIVDWQETALEEFLERKKSEEANRILKSILDSQVLALTEILQQPSLS